MVQTVNSLSMDRIVHAARLSLLAVSVFCICDVLWSQDDPGTWTELSVSAKRIGEPALSHRLFPDDSRRNPGNAAVIALRLSAGKNPHAWEQLVTNAPHHLALSQQEFSAEEAREEVPLWFFDELRRAAFCRDANWEYPLDGQVPRDAIRISGAADYEHILRSVAVHGRADIAEGDIPGALEKIKVGLGMVAHLQEPPFGVIKVLRAQDTHMFLDLVEEAVQHGSAPNLYWSLTAVPDPLVDLQLWADWIRRRPWLHVHEADHLDKERSEKEWRSIRLQMGLFEIPKFFIDADTPTPEEVRNRYRKFVEQGRANLAKIQPQVRDDVDTMSDEEVAVRYFIAKYRIYSDAYVRALFLRPAEGLPRLRESLRKFRSDEAGEIGEFIPDVSDVYISVWMIRRRLAALRIVEALRDYHARHGTFPDSLDQIDAVPIPEDPFTGGHFNYELDDDTAEISASAVETPAGTSVPGVDSVGIHYKLRIRDTERTQGVRFGAAAERIIYDIETDETKGLIDLDSGEFHKLSQKRTENEEPQSAKLLRAFEQGVDVYYDNYHDNTDVSSLFGINMLALPIGNWAMSNTDDSRARQLRRIRRMLDSLDKFGDPGTPVLLSGRGKLPVTYVFQTGQGGRGVLQIVDLIGEGPKAIKFRYKLILPSSNAETNR